MELRSVAKLPGLRQSFLIETFNLKGAIEYLLDNKENARECLTDMPPRTQAELDTVTLHNRALFVYGIDQPQQCAQELESLLSEGLNFPPEAFANLILLCCRLLHYDIAADLLAENIELSYSCLSTVSY